MYLIPEKELYTVLQLFYCARYAELAKADLVHELDFTDWTYEAEATNYQVRAQLLLGNYKAALEKIEANKKTVAEQAEGAEGEFLGAELESLVHYAEFLQDASDEGAKAYFSQDGLSGGLTSLLAACYYAKMQDYDTALNKLQPDGDLENVVFGTYLLLLLGQDVAAEKFLNAHIANDAATDTIGYNQASAWVDLGKYGESLQKAYYHYDEFAGSENTRSLKGLVSLLAAQLKLLQFPEAEEVLKTIEQYKAHHAAGLDAWDCDLLVNEIAFQSIRGNSEQAATLLTQLKTQHPTAAYLKDLDDKEQLFDAVVAKYAN